MAKKSVIGVGRWNEIEQLFGWRRLGWLYAHQGGTEAVRKLCEWKEGNGCTVTPRHRSVIKTKFQSHSDLYRVGLTWKCAGCTPQQEPLTIVKLMLEGQVERHCLKFGATELAAVCDKLRVRTSCVFSWLSWKVCCARFVSCFFFTFKYVRWHPGNATQLTNIFLQNCWRP